MKLNILLLFIAFFAVEISAQNLACMVPDKIDAKATSASMLLKSTSANIKSIRIISEKTGKTSKQEIKQNITYEINLKIENDISKFNVFGYDNNDSLIPGEICSNLTITKSEASQQEANANSVASNQSPNDNQSPPKKDSGKDNSDNISKDEPKTQSNHFRAVVGLEQVGASSATSKQQPFFDLFFSTPFGSTPSNTKGWKRNLQFSIWGNVRFSTTPVQGINSLSNFTLPTFATNFVQGDSASKVNDLVQSFDFLTGFELQVFKSKRQYFNLLPGISSVSLILAGGAVTPLSADKGAAYYKIPRVNNDADIDPRFKEIFPTVTTQKIVAFVTPERDRFFRQYFAGFRFKTNYLKKTGNQYEDRDDLVPGMFDVTFGQSEAVTTKLKGIILRLDGSIPIPLFNNNFLYVFGSAQMRMGRNIEKPLPGIFLEPVSSVALSSADTFIVSAAQNPSLRSNRDTFRFGVGVDILKLFAKEAPK